MSAVLQTTTLDALYQAILATLVATFGDRIATYAPYDAETLLTPGVRIRTPALYLELEEAQADADSKYAKVRERTALQVTLTLHVVLTTSIQAIRQALPQVQARHPQIALDALATAVLVLVRQPAADSRLASTPGNSWGLGPAVTPAGTASLLMTDWGLSGYGIRPVRWEQTLYLPIAPTACLGEVGA